MVRSLGRKKKKFTLYLGVDQMALAGRLAEKSGKSLSALVGEAMHYLFTELGLKADPPEIASDKEMLKQKAKEVSKEQ